jgi:DNA-binding FrmR family transcriptional regulator
MKQDKKNLRFIKRLRIIEGQVRGVQQMMENGTYCIDILTQMSAVKKSLSSLENAVLEQHLTECVVHQIKSGNHKKAISEVMKVYTLSKKSE